MTYQPRRHLRPGPECVVRGVALPQEGGAPVRQLRGAEDAQPNPFSPSALRLPSSVNPLRYGSVLPTTP
jgi:hypothetical protein